MKLKFILFFAVCFTLSFSLISTEAYSLRLILKRVVFEGSKRAEVLTLINATDESETYRLLWRDMIMVPEKGLVEVKESELPDSVKPSKDLIKYAPRRITLPPNSSQQVRMALRIPAGLEDGEYRSHLWIRKEATVDKLRAVEGSLAAAQNKRKVQIELLPGITIPVIVRKGNLDLRVGIANASVKSVGDTYQLNFSLLREGQKSTYGDLDFICNPNNGSYEFKSSRGIAIYAELNEKPMSFKFKRSPELPACRQMKIRYVQTDGYAGDDVALYAETTVIVK